MKKVLLTGMSGTGKSTVIARLSAMGYRAIDLDGPDWSKCHGDGDRIWHEDRVRALLARNADRVTFVSGCATNQIHFHGHFDATILLSAPRKVPVEIGRAQSPS